jgi:hypothetical protein
MKQSAAKTLGVAALGVAFAAAAAGTASASVVPTLPDAGSALGTVGQTLPLESAVSQLPSGAPEALAAGQSVLGSAQRAVPAVGGAGNPVAGLLGGLPVGGALPGLPGLGG